MTGPQSGSDGAIVVVGASLAGMNAAQVLRRNGYDGKLTVFGDEAHRPYDRPPLSKEFLTGDVDLDRLTLPPARKLDELELNLVLGQRAVGLDLGRSVLSVAKTDVEATDIGAGAHAVDEVPFAGLVIATGSRARSLPSEIVDGGLVDVDGLLTLRNLDDARRLREALVVGTTGPPSEPVIVCGAGFIGGEVAASARSLGRDVVLLEAADAPLTRVLDAEVGMAVAELHREQGVDVRLSTSLAAVHHDGSRVSGVTLSDGSMISTSTVVVGIGAVPNTEWLEGAGLTIDNGVVVDEHCRAAANTVAAGDVARFPNQRFGGSLMRIEQWDNAVEMARSAAGTLLSDLSVTSPDQKSDSGFAPVPWFWSDQYDAKIQLAGIRSDHATMAKGNLADHQFVRLYLNGESLCGVLAWNRPRQAIIGRQLISQGASLAEAMEKLSG